MAFFLDFLEIIDILLSHSIDKYALERLTKLITNHHKNYIHLFEDTLKPKHHLMLHYPRIIALCGPPRKYWCYLFEAKHKSFKTYCRNVNSRKNIALTISIKYQLQFAQQLIMPKESFLSLKQLHRTCTMHEAMVHDYCTANRFPHFTCYIKCVYRGKKFKRGYYLCQYVDSLQPENSIVFKLEEILLFSNCEVPHLLCQRVNVINYSRHFAALELATCNTDDEESHASNDADKYAIFCIDRLLGPPLNVNRIARSRYMLRPKLYY